MHDLARDIPPAAWTYTNPKRKRGTKTGTDPKRKRGSRLRPSLALLRVAPPVIAGRAKVTRSVSEGTGCVRVRPSLALRVSVSLGRERHSRLPRSGVSSERIFALTVCIILAVACTAGGQSLQVDIGRADGGGSGNNALPGFVELAAANRGGAAMGRGDRRVSMSAESPLGVAGRVAVTVDAAEGPFEMLAFRRRGGKRGPRGQLAEDFVFNEVGLELTLADLKPGLYAVTTWHHDNDYAGGTIDVAVGSCTVVGGLVQTTGRSVPPASAAFEFRANGNDPVVIRISSQSRDDKFVAYLNGFAVVPIRAVAAFDQGASIEPMTQTAGDARITLSLGGVEPGDVGDQGALGQLSGHPAADLLRDFVVFDASSPEHVSGNMTVDLAGLKPNALYLLTWHCFASRPDAAAMFVYRDRVAEDTLLFSNADDFLYTKSDKLESETSPDESGHAFAVAADEEGMIHLVAGRGCEVGSDDVADGPTVTRLNGLEVGSSIGLSDDWLARFSSNPKIGIRTAVNPAGDSLGKDYSSEVELIPPTPPEMAEATFEVEPGFRVELVAAEPLVMDPVCMSFDERGRLFVAEMRGYNQGNRAPASEARALALETQKLGCVKLLEDTDGDGRFDTSTVYVDDLIWPNGVAAYDGGVFVAAAPEMLYCKDTDGDGKADIRRVVFDGFGFSNWQHLPNSFRWGLDNRIHGASGSGGGAIRRPDRPQEEPTLIRGRDFAFDPRTLDLAPTNSSAQFGLSFDSWGNKYLTSNSDHILLVFFEDRYVARNPFLAAPRSWRLIAAEGRGADVFRISPPEPHRVVWMRMRATGVIKGIIERGGAPTGYITAAGGTTIYRGDAWPRQYRDNSFTPECSGNLLHRNVLEPDGVGQIARRTDAGREFLASRDIWFRPVNMLNGPDGNLYMADMYRQVINEGVVLPPALRKCFDLTEGSTMGRIYRIVPEDFRQPEIPDLGKATTPQLVALLEHANAWHYTTAARLLCQRQDVAAVAPLAKMASASPFPLGRLHAMWALDGLGALSAEMVPPWLDDAHPRVREHAVRLSERVLAASPTIRQKLAAMVKDDDIRVRYQLAFTLGNAPGSAATGALASLAVGDSEDEWIRLAILSSSRGRAGELFALVAADPSRQPTSGGRLLLERLAEQTGLQNEAPQVQRVQRELEKLAPADRTLAQAAVRALLNGLARVGSPLRDELVADDRSVLARLVTQMVQQAADAAIDDGRTADRRAAAVGSLAFAPFEQVATVLAELVDSRQPHAVAFAAIETLDAFDEEEVAEMLIEAWSGLTPRLRATATAVLFAKRRRLARLLDSIEAGEISPSQLDPTRVESLLAHPDQPIRNRASQLFENREPGDRQKVVEAYRSVLDITGDAVRGKAVFKRECATCHRLEGVGYDLGLPLGSIKDRGPEGILANLLDPNSNINPEYTNYVVVTDDGRTVTGMIVAETANSITFRRAEDESDTVMRTEIDELVDTGISIMPEGLEKKLEQREMADLIAYLMSVD